MGLGSEDLAEEGSLAEEAGGSSKQAPGPTLLHLEGAAQEVSGSIFEFYTLFKPPNSVLA